MLPVRVVIDVWAACSSESGDPRGLYGCAGAGTMDFSKTEAVRHFRQGS